MESRPSESSELGLMPGAVTPSCAVPWVGIIGLCCRCSHADINIWMWFVSPRGSARFQFEGEFCFWFGLLVLSLAFQASSKHLEALRISWSVLLEFQSVDFQ
ncbi:hypothetical protein BDDG_12420 [Blastomyces dermatitidis ATCC 18188]|uniref:Uncharacterized protein n=1 Tax=Ajellomyces dermatitidis (strain ATCC 18188 / CBS 674.68) TaxID=653446 RepID=A0A0J9HFN9_AJEDA|nr:hypothetical protein BDDG_12420 [Blastomyces dermatitidis ATCC 18188]